MLEILKSLLENMMKKIMNRPIETIVVSVVILIFIYLFINSPPSDSFPKKRKYCNLTNSFNINNTFSNKTTNIKKDGDK